MEYVIPIEDWYDAKAISRSNLSVIRYVYNKLDDEHKKKLRDSCFGKFCGMEDLNLSGKLMHSLLLRRKAHQNSHTESIDEELWFGFGDERLCFSLLDFTLITGLNPGNEEELKSKIPSENRLLKEYFDGAESVVPKRLKEVFEKDSKTEDDRYKLGLVYIYEGMLRAKEPSTSIEVMNLAIVDDLDLFNKYPWGRKCYDFTIRVFLRKNISRVQYALWGFPIALQVWAFECIPDVAKFFGASKIVDKMPRMCSWKSILTPSYEEVENAIRDSEVCSLEPTRVEIEESYMGLFSEEFSHESGNRDMPSNRDLAGEAKVSSPRNETDRASVERMSKDEIRRPSSPLIDVVSPRHQSSHSRDLKRILDVIVELGKKVGELDKKIDVKVDALGKKIDVLDKKIDTLSGKVNTPARAQLKTSSVEDEDGGVSKMNHTIKTTPVKDEDDDVHMMDHALKLTPVEDGDAGASILNNTPGVPLEVEQLCVKIDTLDAKIEVCEIEKESRKDDMVIEVSEHDGKLLREDDGKSLGDDDGKLREENDKQLSRENAGESRGENDDQLSGVNAGESREENDDQLSGVNVDEPRGENEDQLSGKNGHEPRGENVDESSGENDDQLSGDNGAESVSLDPVSARLTRNLQNEKIQKVSPHFVHIKLLTVQKKKDLDKWLEKAVESEELKLKFCNVSRKFFDDLLGEEWLMSDHIDIALYHTRERAAQYPTLFDQNSCILDTLFLGFMTEAYKIMLNVPRPKTKEDKLSALPLFFNNSDEAIVGKLVRYVDGRSPLLGKVWKGCRFIYIPCCINEHWVALKVDIQERKIEVYNSLERKDIREGIYPLEMILPKLIRSRVDESYGIQRLRMEHVVCPQQSNGFDCGMFTLKYIEFLLAGRDVRLVQPDYMREWRTKLATDIFAQHFDP